MGHGRRAAPAVTLRSAEWPATPRRSLMIALLLWILGVPGLIIILLLLLGVIKL
jgi:hypothetical protein